ncbi:HEAT repeat domain-containing protein [Kitasatospora sp. NPDC059722]|uniref:HEAT repeat domain-containing protein n=1 Tax=Kitasatospora sp. NPDC059722 TaxID=3346925 RepID=UPI00369E6096
MASLNRLADPAGVPTLTTALTTAVEQQQWRTAAVALHTLASIGSVAAPALETVRPLAGAEDPDLRLAAAKALWDIEGDPADAVPRLTTLLGTDRPARRPGPIWKRRSAPASPRTTRRSSTPTCRCRSRGTGTSRTRPPSAGTPGRRSARPPESGPTLDWDREHWLEPEKNIRAALCLQEVRLGTKDGLIPVTGTDRGEYVILAPLPDGTGQRICAVEHDGSWYEYRMGFAEWLYRYLAGEDMVGPNSSAFCPGSVLLELLPISPDSRPTPMYGPKRGM